MSQSSTDAEDLPKWDFGNLAVHLNRRASVDGKCVKDLLQIDRPINQEDIKKLSKETFLGRLKKGWYKTEARKKGGGQGAKELRYVFVDKRLVQGVTDEKREKWITCYHWHQVWGSCPGPPPNEAESDNQLIDFKAKLKRNPDYEEEEDYLKRTPGHSFERPRQ